MLDTSFSTSKGLKEQEGKTRSERAMEQINRKIDGGRGEKTQQSGKEVLSES